MSGHFDASEVSHRSLWKSSAAVEISRSFIASRNLRQSGDGGQSFHFSESTDFSVSASAGRTLSEVISFSKSYRKSNDVTKSAVVSPSSLVVSGFGILGSNLDLDSAQFSESKWNSLSASCEESDRMEECRIGIKMRQVQANRRWWFNSARGSFSLTESTQINHSFPCQSSTRIEKKSSGLVSNLEKSRRKEGTLADQLSKLEATFADAKDQWQCERDQMNSTISTSQMKIRELTEANGEAKKQIASLESGQNSVKEKNAELESKCDKYRQTAEKQSLYLKSRENVIEELHSHIQFQDDVNQRNSQIIEQLERENAKSIGKRTTRTTIAIRVEIEMPRI
jgi:hypothetical protein